MNRFTSDQSALYVSLPFIGSTAGLLGMFAVIAVSVATMMA